MVEDVHALRACHLLQDALDLGVVLRLDDFVVCEVLLDARPVHVLEAVLVERELGLATAHVVHEGWLGVRPDVGGGLALGRNDVAVRRLVGERLEVVQRGRDVAGSEDCSGGHYVG